MTEFYLFFNGNFEQFSNKLIFTNEKCRIFTFKFDDLEFCKVAIPENQCLKRDRDVVKKAVADKYEVSIGLIKMVEDL